jgi:ribonucleotide monophosphatase NagD (HAD superfamily)
MRNFLKLQKRTFTRVIPSVSFDVDGVLKVGNVTLSKARESIIKLRERKIPISLITNGGGEIEGKRGERVSNIIGLEDKFRIKGDEVFLCHTPMKDLYERFKDKIILIAGIKESDEVIESYGFTKYLTANEYFTLFDGIVPYFSCLSSNDGKNKVREKVEKRLGRTFGPTDYPQIHSIFTMTDISNWELNAQVIVRVIRFVPIC